MCLPVFVPGVPSTFPRALQIACMTGAKRLLRGGGGAVAGETTQLDLEKKGN